MEEIIKTDSLSKNFGRVPAVDDISISVRKGEIYGFLGLNGAGKTTTIRMLLGMISPSSGAVYIKGKPVRAGDTSLWKDTGYLVEIPFSYPDLTVYENLEIVRRLRFLKSRESVDQVMEKLRLVQYRNRKAKNLSLGNAQRLGLAKAMIHNPGILILDEPANGLDPAGIAEIRELMIDLSHNHGTTIFISSHILGEISKFATRIGIIHKGRIIQEVDTDKLDLYRRRSLFIKALDINAAGAALEKEGHSFQLNEDGVLELKGGKALSHPEMISELLVHAGCPPVMLKLEEEDLETYFLRTVGMTVGMNGGIQ